MKIRARIIIYSLLSVFALMSASAAMAETSPELFGTHEVRNNNLRPFPKWTGMLERYFADAGAKPGPCTAKVFNRCHAERWQEVVDQLQGRDLTTQLHYVNKVMNKRRYIVDPINWGVRDYWSTPGQFFAKFGDCEDYAIAKYLTLKRLGVPAADMRIVVLQDLNLRVAHAILVVYTEDGAIILDNQIKRTVQASAIHHYKPIFSINEDSWWLHRPKYRKRG
jgi:predicted transglutaminase-like cysteine proteinase